MVKSKDFTLASKNLGGGTCPSCPTVLPPMTSCEYITVHLIVSQVIRLPRAQCTSDIIHVHMYMTYHNNSGEQKSVPGEYMAVHMRREDFKQAHPSAVPPLELAARQVNTLLLILLFRVPEYIFWYVLW